MGGLLSLRGLTLTSPIGLASLRRHARFMLLDEMPLTIAEIAGPFLLCPAGQGNRLPHHPASYTGGIHSSTAGIPVRSVVLLVL